MLMRLQPSPYVTRQAFGIYKTRGFLFLQNFLNELN